MKKLIFGLLLAVVPSLAMSSANVHLDSANVDLTDKASLQRGAKYFFNYCSGCHSLRYMRYNRMATDLGLSEQDVIENLMTTEAKIAETITIAMDPSSAKSWFGVTPPDLSLITRAKKHGEDWLYTYLRSFYLDPSRPLGVNNTVFPDVGMPHALWELQGWQEAIFEESTDDQGNKRKVFEGFELKTQGEMSPAQYDNAVRDLVAFLAYVGEPVKLERQSLGIYVLLFLVVFFAIAYPLKKEYWKDIH